MARHKKSSLQYNVPSNSMLQREHPKRKLKEKFIIDALAVGACDKHNIISAPLARRKLSLLLRYLPTPRDQNDIISVPLVRYKRSLL